MWSNSDPNGYASSQPGSQRLPVAVHRGDLQAIKSIPVVLILVGVRDGKMLEVRFHIVFSHRVSGWPQGGKLNCESQFLLGKPVVRYVLSL